jgi:type I restriction enzyme S subunit
MIGRYGPPIFQIFKGLEGAYNVALIKAIPNEKKLTREYCYYFLTRPEIRKYLESLSQRSGGQTGIEMDKLRSYPLPLPPLPEQRAIADILSTWDRGIEKLQQLIAAKQKHKKALMQQLLTGKKRFPEFIEEWKEVRMGDIFERVKRTSQDPSIESYTISSKSGFVTQEDKFNRVIAGSSLSKYTCLRRNEFSYNKGNSKTFPYGCIFKFENEAGLVPFVYISFKLKKNTNSDTDFYKQYFYHGLLERQLKRIITSGARGDGLLNVSADDFFKLKILKPCFSEQQKIASILLSADQEIAIQERKLEALKQQKKGLMQKLLTGQVRVKIKENV